MAGTTPGDIGHRLARLAARQHGVLSRAQLVQAGMSKSAIGRAVAAGRLHPVFPGTYALGHPRVGPRGRMLAATLACGDGAFVSHRSAAALLGLTDTAPATIDVIAIGERGRRIDGIRFHDVRRPRREETGTVDGVPCTSPARTLVDLAGTLSTSTLRGCFERAATRRSLNLAAVEASLDPGRRGVPALRTLLREWRAAAPPGQMPRLRSPFEAKVLALLVAAGLPRPRVNAPVQVAARALEVDFLWEAEWVVVEADGRRHHDGPAAFERDRRRDRELTRAGYTVLRITWRSVEREPDAVLAAIAAALRGPGRDG